MNPEAFFKMTYGIYLVSSKSGEQLCGYIANTVFQVTAEPPTDSNQLPQEQHQCKDHRSQRSIFSFGA